MLNTFITKGRWVILGLLCSTALMSCDRLLTPDFNTEVSELRGGQYTLDTDHAALLFKINHLGFSTFIGRFTAFDASLDFDPEDIEASSVEVIVDMTSLDVNLPEFEEELLGSNCFDAAQFPQAIYRTTSFVGNNGNDYEFAGELTMHGITAPLDLVATLHGRGRSFLTRTCTLRLQASANSLRSDCGVVRSSSCGAGDAIDLQSRVESHGAAGAQ